MQKSYYNRPTGITNVNMNDGGMKVYPNPAADGVNVEVNASLSGNLHVEIINMVGQKMAGAEVMNHKASFNVRSLPAGVYLADLYRAKGDYAFIPENTPHSFRKTEGRLVIMSIHVPRGGK